MAKSARELILRYLPDFSPRACGRIITDTSEFMDIDYGDVIAAGGQHYLVFKNEMERSFGLEDPKYWVKRCKVLETGERKILKLVFHENFPITIGHITITCYRSPRKEARILDLVRGDMRFMQGISVQDDKDNNIRILDIVRGRRLDMVIDDIEADHYTYFHEYFPEVLEKFIDACEGIKFLHAHGEKHGDIRRDHLWQEYETGNYRWIDFDYTFESHENPFGLDIYGLGNLLIFYTGKVFYGPATIKEMFDLNSLNLERDDFSILFHNRLANLKKVFSYIPASLSWVLLHFSLGTDVFYDNIEELLFDMHRALKDIKNL